MRWRAMALLLAVLPGAGCLARPKTIPAVPVRTLRAASPDEVLAAYEAYANGNETLSASGDLEKNSSSAYHVSMGTSILSLVNDLTKITEA